MYRIDMGSNTFQYIMKSMYEGKRLEVNVFRFVLYTVINKIYIVINMEICINIF